MKRKLLVFTLAIVLILSLSVVGIAEETEKDEPMTEEEFLDTFNFTEIGAWKMAKKFISERETATNLYFYVEEFILPENKTYIKKIDENIYEVYIEYKYNDGESIKEAMNIVTLEKVSDYKWKLLEYH